MGVLPPRDAAKGFAGDFVNESLAGEETGRVVTCNPFEASRHGEYGRAVGEVGGFGFR